MDVEDAGKVSRKMTKYLVRIYKVDTLGEKMKMKNDCVACQLPFFNYLSQYISLTCIFPAYFLQTINCFGAAHQSTKKLIFLLFLKK